MTHAKKDDVYHDYLLIRQMRADSEVKRKILERVVSRAINGWRVIGITRAALQKFKDNGCRYRSRSGIERAHLIDRKLTYTRLVEKEYVRNQFWELISENDKTILTVSGERTSPKDFDVILFDPEPSLFDLPSETNFGSKAVGYRHNKRERLFLEQLCADHLIT